ncbi:hypothetical protein AAC03nite_34340 [Alicyclobacillus acidoterrestris]|nr:hypothetical protein AAC03nite_34340 [Alicyclobacillus acidoterrestris]
MKLSRLSVFLCAGIIMLAVVGCGSTSTASNGTHKTASTVEAGDNATVNTADDLVATSKDALNRLQNDVSANNDDDVQSMVINGDVLQLPKGTKVYVEDLSFSGVAHIQIKSGDYTGQNGYIPYEQLTPSK